MGIDILSWDYDDDGGGPNKLHDYSRVIFVFLGVRLPSRAADRNDKERIILESKGLDIHLFKGHLLAGFNFYGREKRTGIGEIPIPSYFHRRLRLIKKIMEEVKEECNLKKSRPVRLFVDVS